MKEGSVVCTAQVEYWDGVSKPVFYMTDDLIPQGQSQMFSRASLKFSLRDLREFAAATALDLDKEGFRFIRHSTSLTHTDFFNTSTITGTYYEEIRKLLLEQVPGATRVIIFDHNVRSANLDLHADKERFEQAVRVSVAGPVRFAHNDYTHNSGPLRLLALTRGRGSGGSYIQEAPLLTELEAEGLLQKRFAIIQAWRPINKPVQDCPLAILDANSIKETDLVESTLVYPDRKGHTYIVAPNPKHNWYFAPKMTREEIMLFKCYDSQLDGRTRFTAHSAFDIPDAPLDAPPRESIEIRALVFFDEPRSPESKSKL